MQPNLILRNPWLNSALKAFAWAVMIFLLLPIIITFPISFSASPFFTYTEGMLKLQPEAYSLQWYQRFFADANWILAIKNSFIIGISTTFFAVILGTLASLGLSSRYMPFRSFFMVIILSPIIIPVILVGASMFLFYSKLSLTNSLLSIIVAHTALSVPFVVITVTAALASFDHGLVQAAYSMGANRVKAFFDVTLPLIAPGIFSGGLFAFVTSFDEVVVVLFLAGPSERTIPRQMFSGLREEINPTILAASTMLAVLAMILLYIFNKIQQRQAFYNR